MSRNPVIVIIMTVYAYFLMKKVLKESQIDAELTRGEKIQVIITTLLNPLISWLIYYFGWREKLPMKAKQATKYFKTIIIVLIVMALVAIVSAFILMSVNSVVNVGSFDKQ